MPIWLLAANYYDVLLEVLGNLRTCYVSSPVAKILVWIENHDWAQLFLDVFLVLTLAGPKKASKSTILQNRLNKKKLLVDVANLATCCHDDYDVLLKVLGTLGKCHVSSPVAKTLAIMTGTAVFGCLPGAHPCWTQKSFKTNNFT